MAQSVLKTKLAEKKLSRIILYEIRKLCIYALKMNTIINNAIIIKALKTLPALNSICRQHEK